MLKMDNIKEKLIDLFANHSTVEIEQNIGELLNDITGVGNYRQITGNKDFQRCFAALKKLRDDLDVVMKEKEKLIQVKGCLSWINETKKEAERNENCEYFELSIELVRRGIYSGNWDKDQRSYFDTGIEMMKEWNDFFLSYTNRNCPETNNDFGEIIRGTLGQDFFEKNKDNSNCVAHLISHYLELNNLKCFFDKHSLKCGDILKEKIFEHCTSVYVFVQLVEMATFKYGEGEINWCYREFQEFDRWAEKFEQDHFKKTNRAYYNRFQFILTADDEDVFPAELHGSYEKWKDKIKERVYIKNLGRLGSKPVIRRKMKELAEEIKNNRNKMLEDYYS